MLTSPCPVTHTIAAAQNVSGLSRTKLYELVGEEKLKAVKAGRRTLITAESLNNYLASLPPAAIGRQHRKAA